LFEADGQVFLLFQEPNNRKIVCYEIRRSAAMSETYCDIIPHADGWAYLFEGRQSAVYPSYRLAAEAALTCSEQFVGNRGKFVLRQQDLRGRMHEVQGRSDVWLPVGRAAPAQFGGAGQA
jgi:hypothetical protein